MTNRQQVKSRETNVRILNVDLIGNLSPWELKSRQRDHAASKAGTQGSHGLFFLHAPENPWFPTMLFKWALSRMKATN